MLRVKIENEAVDVLDEGLRELCADIFELLFELGQCFGFFMECDDEFCEGLVVDT